VADNTDDPIDLDAAYALVTPEDNRELYARWADSYDDGFLETHGYVYNKGVAELFARYASPGGPILDVGCGTGAVAEALVSQGLGSEIHGIDISPEMLEMASQKRQRDGKPLYSKLIEADLTQTIDLEINHYSGGIISAGAFTHGHLNPSCIDELLRVAAPGSTAAIGVNSAHYVVHGFADYFETKRQANLISKVEIVELAIYDASVATLDDKSELDSIAYVAIFINKTD
jgi:ubiquinone/menaquinone biosynthesis C-methylase UbiE